MDLTGMVVPMSALEAEQAERAMTECFIEEYLRLGYYEETVLELFRNPFYQATHAVYQAHGEGYVRELIRSVRNCTTPVREEVTNG